MSERSKYTSGLIETVLCFSVSVDGPEITTDLESPGTPGSFQLRGCSGILNLDLPSHLQRQLFQLLSLYHLPANGKG